MSYWLLLEGEESGPFTIAQLELMVEKDLISPDASVKDGENGEWTPVVILLRRAAPPANHLPASKSNRKPLIRLPVLSMILILGVVFASIGLLLVMRLNKRALLLSQARETENTLQDVMGALISYELLAGTYPTERQGLQALISRPALPPQPTRWEPILEQYPIDAWGQKLHYRASEAEDGSVPELVSAGPDGALGTPDDLSSRTLNR